MQFRVSSDLNLPSGLHARGAYHCFCNDCYGNFSFDTKDNDRNSLNLICVFGCDVVILTCGLSFAVTEL
jgi:hypothetical protein